MKNYKLKADEFVQLIPPMGGCIATDKITVDGLPIIWMYRDEPVNDIDTGWQFTSGTETEEYMADNNNSAIYEVNTIANYEPAIIPYLNMPVGTELRREEGTNRFIKIN